MTEMMQKTTAAAEEIAAEAGMADRELPAADPVMEEHRAALAKMRLQMALDALFAASGAKDAWVLARLIDIEDGDAVIGADGVPDLGGVRRKIAALRRELAYLFTDGDSSADREKAAAVSGGATGMRLGTGEPMKPSDMSDAEYYRYILRQKRSRS